MAELAAAVGGTRFTWHFHDGAATTTVESHGEHLELTVSQVDDAEPWRWQVTGPARRMSNLATTAEDAVLCALLAASTPSEVSHA